jgi:hypothetical protein
MDLHSTNFKRPNVEKRKEEKQEVHFGKNTNEVIG